MIRHLMHVDFDRQRGLQEQVRESLVNAILGGIFAAETPLPVKLAMTAMSKLMTGTTYYI